MRRRPLTAYRLGRLPTLAAAGVSFLTIVLAGCATAPISGVSQEAVATPVTEPSRQDGHDTSAAPIREGWWRVRFRMNWPEGEEPAWPVDVLIAHRIVAPVLRQYRDDIELWRFHRRAARDGAGHQFSLIFYAPPRVAERLYARLQDDPLLRRLQREHSIEAVSYTSTVSNQEPHIESTSDPNWPAVIQKSWPYFIMGVSEMWLDLVDKVAGETSPAPGPSTKDLKNFYARVNENISALWRDQGQHAFLHHLSGVFGYERMLIRETRSVQF
jgi:hypothetical protein